MPSKQRNPHHGQMLLPATTVDSYSLSIRASRGGGFVGDVATRGAFSAMVETWQTVFREMDGGRDPLGGVEPHEFGAHLDDWLASRKPAAHIVQAAIEDFAHQLATVIRRFARHPSWAGVERIVVGGGFSDGAAGRAAVKRTAKLLAAQGETFGLEVLHHHPDEGGLVGWAHAVPARALAGAADFLAVDIGGTNARCGIVRTHRDKAPDLHLARVVKLRKWKHAHDDDGRRRGDVVDGIADMLRKLLAHAERRGIVLAPLVGVACPGVVLPDGYIAAGTQNLPGDWTSPKFHLAGELQSRLQRIHGRTTRVLLHNDAVIQGLSQRPFMRGTKRWAVLTVGTGLGNASFTNRAR